MEASFLQHARNYALRNARGRRKKTSTTKEGVVHRGNQCWLVIGITGLCDPRQFGICVELTDLDIMTKINEVK